MNGCSRETEREKGNIDIERETERGRETSYTRFYYNGTSSKTIIVKPDL